MTVPDPQLEAFTAAFSALTRTAGQSVRALASSSGVGRSTIHSWITGQALPRSHEDLLAVVHACTAVTNAEGTLRGRPRSDREWRGLLAGAKQARDARSPTPRHAITAPLRPVPGSSPVAVLNVPPRNPFFVGRDDLLEAIHHRLHPTDVTNQLVSVLPLHGIAGVGKTQLAIEYVHRYADHYHLVWWVSIDNPTVAFASLAALAGQLGLPVQGPPETALIPLWAELTRRTDWLLIYDNADSFDLLADLLPPSTGRLLITGRTPAIGRIAAILKIGEFDRSESTQLLGARCPVLTTDEADLVARELGDLPLAVEQAGCFLDGFLTDTSLSVEDYLEQLQVRPTHAGLAEPTLYRHSGLVAVVVASRDRLAQLCPPAACLLDQLAFLAPEPLPVIPVRSTPRAGQDGVHLGDVTTTALVLRHLSDLGLIKRIDGAIQVHRLVQSVVRALLTVQEQLRTRLMAGELLASSSPGNPDNPADWPAYAVLTPHVQALANTADVHSTLPPSCRELLLKVLHYLHASAQYSTARDLAEHTFHAWRQLLGANDLDTLWAAQYLGATLRASGEHEKARVLNDDTFARRRRILGPDHPDTLRSANNLAFNLSFLGEYKEARVLNDDTFARRRRILGPDHPDTLRSANSLAFNLSSLGQHEEARKFNENTLTRQRRTLGADHPDTLLSATDLALNLRHLDDCASAIELDQDTLARRQKVLGVDHPDTLISARNLRVDLATLNFHEQPSD
ncbi:FxSxx-COOH system tetratricopeptide repeat protein [Amycolatopsis sp. cmx-8-4]|uniref:FxSxx-COOH system tetratricopeptide repeat protein n=1 Tax=Amycolatopsis sp. cmx-8-4 TaxID=2790947 RepID=UPI00397CF098